MLTKTKVYYTDFAIFNSTNVRQGWYDETTESLYVLFHSGDNVYQYGAVSPETWQDFIAALSPGSFYAYTIRGTQPRGLTLDLSECDFVFVSPYADDPEDSEDEESSVQSGRLLVLTFTLDADAIIAASQIVRIAEAVDEFTFVAEVF